MRERTQRRQRIAASALAVLLAGCAALPPLSPRPPCHALADTDGTALARLFAAARAAHPGESGYALFDDGRASATTRFDLAAVAERSIDLQTFAWSDDVMGGATWSALLGAAARGVRVRVLVDDVALDGRARLPCRPNLEIRVINPFAQRRFRLFELLRRFATLDRRMHNKLYVVDGQVAFVGGRNVGDAYFGLGRRYNYRDLDVATVGPVVAQAEAAFDAYWNSARAYPASAFCDASPAVRARVERGIDEAIARSLIVYPYPIDGGREGSLGRLAAVRDRLCWGPGEVVWDRPERLVEGARVEGPPAVALRALAEATRREVTIESPYFVPSDDLLGIAALRARGVPVRILTNSLDSTDHVPVFVGYQRSRRELLESGVELHEVRPDAASRALYTTAPSSESRLGLHAKVEVFDRRTVAIGSFNLDPRSHYLNTEVLLVAHSPELAERTLALLERDFSLDNAYRLVLGEHGGIAWVDVERGRLHRTGFEPHAFLRRLIVILLSLLPIDGFV